MSSEVESDLSVTVEQDHSDLVGEETWRWAVLITLAAVGLIANTIFIVTFIYNRKRHDLKTFVSAVILTIAFLDVFDVLRVAPVLSEDLFNETIFRHVFCSFGIFHELAVASMIVAIGIAVCCQAGKEPKFYQSARASLVHKILIPFLVLVCAGAAAPFFLLSYDRLSYTCTNPFATKDLIEGKTTMEQTERFTMDLYSTFVTVFTYVLPVLILPLVIPIATVRTCISRQCCVSRFKQPIGELIMVSLVAIIYLGTIVGVVLPAIDREFQLNKVSLGPIPLLWEIGNTAVRPLIYFLTNPAVWDGLQAMCCRNKHQLVNEEDAEEIEVPLSPVTTV